MVNTQLSGDTVMTYMTDAFGDFSFSDILANQDYTIRPSKDNEDENGVSTFDIVIIQQHILAINPIASPYKIIAADVNNSGSVSTFDLVVIRQLILGQIASFPNVDSWRFVDADFEFPDSTNPFLTAFPEFIQIENLVENRTNTNFVAIKMGDINGNASPNIIEEVVEERNEATPLFLNLENQYLEAGFEYTIPLYSENFERIIGFQFEVQWDAAMIEFLEVTDKNLYQLKENRFGCKEVENGILSVSWNHALGESRAKKEGLFSLRFKAKQSAYLKDILQLNPRRLQPEAYDANLAIKPIQVIWEDVPIAEGMILHQNYPNPFVQKTSIPFELPRAASVHFQIFDTQGRLVYTHKNDYPKGQHKIFVERKDFNQEHGIFFYHLSINGHRPICKSMILRDQ